MTLKNNEKPYIKKVKRIVQKKYNPNYGDNRICICGHPYHRHFDSYDNMRPVGCKYCGCNNFVERDDGPIAEIPVHNGKILVFDSTKRDIDDKSVAIMFEASNGETIDLAHVDAKEDENYTKLHIYAHGDPEDESCTYEATIETDTINTILNAKEN